MAPLRRLLLLGFQGLLCQKTCGFIINPAKTLYTPILDNGQIIPQSPIQADAAPDTRRKHGPAVQVDPQEDGLVPSKSSSKLPNALQAVLDAIEVMQAQYFDVFTGTWPSAIDWTAAVCGTQVSATLSTIVSSFEISSSTTCSDVLEWQNIVDRYFAQTSVFYFGENAFALRNQAYDDMLWVVLGWLENIKFVEMYSLKHWDMAKMMGKPAYGWHGLQISPMAAHRSRIFYELASNGWDASLCHGGMNWNPTLTPYKNAITNELFISASISMYLYYPGDNNTSPYFVESETSGGLWKPHEPLHLANAVKAYEWLKQSQMQDAESGLYQDGFHITGWHRMPNGTEHPGTGECDDLNSMVYTYNQGVLLTAQRGLWMTTGRKTYLEEGHRLVDNLIRATGWPNHDRAWHGLGRGGVLEEYCDHGVHCSQDGQTFKGIFFHHLAEFCRPLWAHEEAFMEAKTPGGFNKDLYRYHKARCAAYGAWIAHNARAVSVTADKEGRFGMWWGREYPDATPIGHLGHEIELPPGAVDYVNEGVPRPWKLSQGAHRSQRFDIADVRRTKSVSEDINDRGRGRTVETQSGGLAVLRAHWQWELLFHGA